jgi:hypothetical protein
MRTSALTLCQARTILTGASREARGTWPVDRPATAMSKVPTPVPIREDAMHLRTCQGSEVVTSICGACGHIVERPPRNEIFWLRFERDCFGDDIRVQTSPLPALPDFESLGFRQCARTGSYETSGQPASCLATRRVSVSTIAWAQSEVASTIFQRRPSVPSTRLLHASKSA